MRIHNRLILLAVLLTAVFGAGTVDVLCSDVIPLRPYTGTFVTDLSQSFRQSVSDIGGVLEVALVIFLVSALLVAVANRTTGIVITHSGFTPNANLTGSPGTSSVLQLYPLILAAIGLVATWVVIRNRQGGV